MTKKEETKNDLYALYLLTMRGLKLFLKDKISVFFSMLAPLIVLLLYILFLGDVQVSSVMGAVPEGIAVDEKAVRAFVDCWMLAGVLSVACLTVAFSANTVMVQDKSRGILADSLSAPVKRGVVSLSYYIFNFTVTSVIVLIVFVICMLYLAIAGEWYLSAADVLGIFGVTLLSILSSSLVSVFICSFFTTEAQHGSVVGIFSAILGFLIGAYMPMSIMPKAAQYVSAVLPGSHSAGLYRNLFMRGALDNLSTTLPAPVTDALSVNFSMRVDVFGTDVGMGFMLIYLSVSVVVFALMGILGNKKALTRGR